MKVTVSSSLTGCFAKLTVTLLPKANRNEFYITRAGIAVYLLHQYQDTGNIYASKAKQ